MPQKCFRCFQSSHWYNECPPTRQLQIVESAQSDEDITENNPGNEELEELKGDDGQYLSCVVEKVLLHQNRLSTNNDNSG